MCQLRGHLFVLSVLALLTAQVQALAPMITKGEQKKARHIAVDLHGDPLPEGAIARLGTVRQRAPGAQIAITADGKEVVTLDANLLIRRFDAQTGALRAVHQLKSENKSHLARLSPRGQYALLASYAPGANQLEIWDISDEKRVGALELGEFTLASPTSVAFSGDERRVALAESAMFRDKHRIRLWDWSASESHLLWNLEERITQFMFDPVLIFSPDGKRLAGIHFDRIMRCWDVGSGKLLWKSQKHIYSGLIAFSADGQQIRNSGSFCWNARTGLLIEGNPRPPDGAVLLLGSSPDGRFLVFDDGLDNVLLWNTKEIEATIRLAAPRACANGIRHILANLPTNLAFTPDGNALVRRAGALQRWDLNTGKPMYQTTEAAGHTEAITALRFSPDGKSLASLAEDNTLRLWNVATRQGSIVLDTVLGACVAFTPDGKKVCAIPESMGKIGLRQWDTATGSESRNFKLPDVNSFMVASSLKELRVTADGRRILLLTWKNGRRNDESILTTWDLDSGACLAHRRVPWAEDSVITPDGTNVVMYDSVEQLVKLVDVDTDKVRRVFATDRAKDPPAPHRCYLALSSGGRLLAAQIAAIDRHSGDWQYDDLRIGEVGTGRQIAKLPSPKNGIFAFSPDEQIFAAAIGNNVQLWETASWRQVGSIQGAGGMLGGRINVLAFAPDGRTLATGHADSTILLWDATLGFLSNGPRFAPSEVDGLWADLADMDAPKAYRAIWRLVGNPEQAISLLHAHLQPVVATSSSTTRPLIERLDSSRFQSREDAKKGLAALGEAAEPALRAALKANPSLEMRRRLEPLLDALDPSRPLRGTPLRDVRAVQILERIGNAEARRMLEWLARGLESASLTRAAKDALARGNK